MPGSSGHVQTVSIIDTISELQRGVAQLGGQGAQLGGQGPRELAQPGRPKPGPSSGSPVARPPALSLQGPGPNMHKARAQANGARAPPPPLPRLPRCASLCPKAHGQRLASVGIIVI